MLSRAGLLGGEAGDRVDGLEADLPGLAVDAAADDLDGLAGAGEEQVVDRAHLQPADLLAAVTGRTGPVLQWDLLPGTGLELPTELLRVALGDHDVVGLPVEQMDGVVVPGVHRVAGDDCAGQILEGVGQRPEAGDLVAVLTDVHLGQDQCVHVVPGGQEVDLPSLRAGRAPQRRPVDREPSQSLSPGLPVREPGSDRPVQGVRVDSGEQSPDRGFRGPGPFRDQRVDGRAEPFEQSRRCAGHPFTHREQVRAPARTAQAVSAGSVTRGCRTPRGWRTP